MRVSFFDKELEKLLPIEGGYVNDPLDPGGETNYGITKRVAVAHGYEGDMRTIPMYIVSAIYKKSYWDINKIDQIKDYSKELASILFDFGVNAGTHRAATYLQRSINLFSVDQIAVDGKIGPKTLAALNKINTNNIFTAFNGLRVFHYIDIVEKRPDQKRFISGWMNRVSNTLKNV